MDVPFPTSFFETTRVKSAHMSVHLRANCEQVDARFLISVLTHKMFTYSHSQIAERYWKLNARRSKHEKMGAQQKGWETEHKVKSEKTEPNRAHEALNTRSVHIVSLLTVETEWMRDTFRLRSIYKLRNAHFSMKLSQTEDDKWNWMPCKALTIYFYSSFLDISM